jgi:hypothetical protein
LGGKGKKPLEGWVDAEGRRGLGRLSRDSTVSASTTEAEYAITEAGREIM